MRNRCKWAGTDSIYIAYHDTEWGVPLHEDRKLFEFLILDGAQAGLSWITILKKRHNYRQAFDQFDPQKIARYDSRKIKQLLSNPEVSMPISGSLLEAGPVKTTGKKFLRFRPIPMNQKR